MTNQTPLRKKLNDLVQTTHPRGIESKIKKDVELFVFVESYWKDTWPMPRIFLEKVWHALHDTSPICDYGNKFGWESWRKGTISCSKQCKCFQELKKKTMIAKYGVEHALQSSELMNKAKTTWQEKYNATSLHEINIDKKFETNISKYGTKTPLENKDIQQKTRENLLKSHGVLFPFQSTDIQNEIQNNWIEKNGKRSFSRDKEDLQKQNYELLKEKLKDKIDYVVDKELFVSTLRNMSRCEMANFIGCSDSLIDKRIVEWNLTEFQSSKSYYEIIISKYLSLLNVEFVENTRQVIAPKELDWWIPSKKLGIEFCGLRWHGENAGRDKNYHLTKLQLMNLQNCDLIQIYQDEWDNKSVIVKSILRNKLCPNTLVKVYARKCHIKELDYSTYSEFLEKNHLQGKSIGDIHRYGLFLDKQLVSVIGFRRHKKYKWEISRHCNLIDYRVIGGLSKLIKYFIKINNPDSILSYADLRYFSGNGLLTANFKYIGNTKPGYFYTKGVIREHRLNYTKKILIKNGHNPSLTENEIMKSLGYDKVWDCGHAIWLYQKVNCK